MPRLYPYGASCVYTVVLCVGICHKIDSVALYGVFRGCHVCLYTTPILNAI